MLSYVCQWTEDCPHLSLAINSRISLSVETTSLSYIHSKTVLYADLAASRNDFYVAHTLYNCSIHLFRNGTVLQSLASATTNKVFNGHVAVEDIDPHIFECLNDLSLIANNIHLAEIVD
jgi:hypothetical protein